MSGFTCITCRVAFVDADLQRNHYKTDWHRYNLKRKVADMPPVTAENFQQRVIAQKAQLEDEQRDQSGHCKVCNKHFGTENAFQNHIKSKKHKDMESRKGQQQSSQNVGEASKSSGNVKDKNAINIAIQKALVGGKGQGHEAAGGPSVEMDVDDSDAESWESWEGDALGIEECLFCSYISKSMVKNMKHMTLKHSFFVPDLDYVADLEGLMTYLGEKVGEGHICLWCNEKSKAFRTTQAVQQHMVDKGHCKMLHEGDTVFEYSDFYDYRKSYPDFDPNKADDEEEPMDDDAEEDEDDTQDVEENYQLVLPSGAVIGHRSLQRYYRQKLRPERQVALRNPSSVTRVMAQYKSVGWTGSIGHMVHQKAKDVAFSRRLRSRQHMKLGVKANRLQKHFREQVFGC